MGRDGRWWTVLRSLLALVLAIAAIPAVNLAGSNQDFFVLTK
jgi:hypothetical protein